MFLQESLDTTKSEFESQIEEKVSLHERSLCELKEQNEEKIHVHYFYKCVTDVQSAKNCQDNIGGTITTIGST